MQFDDCITILRETWTAFIEQWKDLAWAAFWFSFLPTTLLGIIEAVSFTGLAEAIETAPKEEALTVFGPYVGFIIAGIIMTILLSILWTIATLEILKTGNGIMESSRAALSRFLAGIGLEIAWGIAIGILLLPLILLWVFGSGGFEDVGRVVLLVLATPVLLIPAFVVSIYWLFAFNVLVMEDAGPIRSLQRSFRLVRGYWWWTFLFIALFFILLMTAALVISIPGGILGFATILVNPTAGNIVNDIVSNLITAVLGLFTIVFLQRFYLLLRKHEKSEELKGAADSPDA